MGPDYHHDAVGFNYRMTNLQAAVGCAQLERLGPFVARKREIQDRYDRAFEGHPGIAVFPRPEWSESACWLAGITLTDASVGAVVNSLRDRGIEARPFWRPVHLQPPYAGAPRTPQPNTGSILVESSDPALFNPSDGCGAGRGHRGRARDADRPGGPEAMAA